MIVHNKDGAVPTCHARLTVSTRGRPLSRRHAAQHAKSPWAANPWLTSPPGDDQDEPPESLLATAPAVPLASGPTAPQAGIPVPEWEDRLPRRGAAAAALLWWVGAHGGAGETTLAALLPESRAAGHAWPVQPDPASVPVPAILVARTSMRGLRAAQLAAADWASGSVEGVELLGLVLIADAPAKLSRPLREFAAVVSGGVPRVWWLPWSERWREGEHPSPQSSPRQARRLVEDARALTTGRRAPRSAPLEGGSSCTAS